MSLLMRFGIFVLGLTLTSTSGIAAALQVGLLLDKAGKDDKSFNASAYAGATRAEKELGINLKTVEAKDKVGAEGLLRSLAQKKYDLLIGIGFTQVDPVQKVAAAFPDRKFVIVDGEVALPNVQSILFAEHEGAFLAGAVAAWKSSTGKVGFIGGMDVPLIRRFELGYVAGAKYANPKIATLSQFLGFDQNAWNNPPRAKEFALNQYNQGADVIFHAAGASGGGVFDAAEEKKKFAIGCDSNQNGVKPGRVLTSMLKRVDLAVFKVIQDFKSGTFKGGTFKHDVKSGGIDLAMDENNGKLFDGALKTKLEHLKKDMVAGKIAVPDYYTQKSQKQK